MTTAWKVAAARVAGFDHEAKGIPCEDSYAVGSAGDGWLVAAVADGAGSAPRSAEGSDAIASGVVAALVASLDAGAPADLEAAVRGWVVDAVAAVRADLIARAEHEGSALSEFNATLVGVVAGPDGGVFFHIGDGAGCAVDETVDGAVVVSKPENGEYANETFFFTQDHWLEHLRLTPFGPGFGVIALMSDGVSCFAMAPGGNAPAAGFFAPVSKFLAEKPLAEGEAGLEALLLRDAVRKITGDDKTFVWAKRIADG